MTTRRTAAMISLGAFIICIGTAFSSGWIRHYVGDVVSASLVFGAVGLALPSWSRMRRAGVALAFCGIIEGLQATQLVGPDAPAWLRIVLGATFDPLDLVAYAVGVVIAVATEVALTRRPTDLPATRRQPDLDHR